MKTIVVALGGNALGNSPKEQLDAVKGSSKALADIIENYENVAIVHGNGPQVGLINLGLSKASEIDESIPEFPLVECVALSQGYIGYHLQQAIENEVEKRNIDKKVVTIVSQVEVDKNDPAFKDPTKPIGTFYSKEEAERIEKEDGYTFKEDAGRGYRRVVASPKPVRLKEIETLKTLLENNTAVITGGGGGIPVFDEDGTIVGVDAVIDKDFVASKISADINADKLLILTAVDSVYINFGKENQEELREISVDEAKKYIEEGQFAKGSMLPKIEACLKFLEENPEGEAIITSLDKALDGLEGKVGTKIVK
ncbi:MAG: carbamate kinase [Anaerococcus prevotii]|uniref:carbamate kinase n=1 Tax=Anaerococcus prevotii TaxID=33034 RepID=UPI00290480B8|nr:carbamate kinase [Anaerococcus prevotii]MDU2559094.1 carbamate kinase [Anaerococcus prevotii]